MSVEESMYQKMARRIETLETQKSNTEYCFRELKKINEQLEQELAAIKQQFIKYENSDAYELDMMIEYVELKTLIMSIKESSK